MTASLRAEPRFVRWAAAEGVSMLGTAVSTVVLPILVYEATGSAAQTGILFALRVVPYLLVGLVAGPIADRGNRRFLIIGGNVGEGLLVATIPIAAALGVLTVAQVYVVALASATVFVFSDAAVFGAVPALVGPQRLPAANGLLSAMASAAEIVGPAIGGVSAVLIGPEATIGIDAVSFLVAAGIQATIPGTFREGTPPSGPWRIRQQAATALSFIRRQRTVAVLIGVGFGNSFAFGAVLGLIVPYAVEQLGVDSDDALVGFLFAAVGVGSFVAGLVFARIFDRSRVPVLTPGALAVSAACAAGLALTTSWPVAIALLTAFSASIATTIVIGITYRQLVAPDELRSSVNVIGRMIAWGGQPFGAAVGAVVAGRVDVAAAVAMAAAVMTASAVVAAVLLRRARPT